MVGNYAQLDFGFQAGMPVDAVDANGTTPLHVAASYNQLKTARHLIELGADAAHANNWGDTPLHRAASQGFAEMCALLLEAGAKMYAKDWSGARPIDLAAEERHSGVLRAVADYVQRNPAQFAGSAKTLVVVPTRQARILVDPDALFAQLDRVSLDDESRAARAAAM